MDESNTQTRQIEITLQPIANDSVSSIEEGQEEWLSEGVLTDEDYNMTHESLSASNQQNQAPTTIAASNDTLNSQTESYELHISAEEPPKLIHAVDSAVTNVEETLKRLEGRIEANEKDTEQLLEELDTFLIRKSDGKTPEEKIKEKNDNDADRNSTDELIKILGESENKMATTNSAKTDVATVDKMASLATAEESTDDDIDQIIQKATKVTQLKFAKNAKVLKKGPAPKAIPEDDYDSTDEDDPPPKESTLPKQVKKPRILNCNPTPTAKSLVRTGSGGRAANSLLKNRIVGQPPKILNRILPPEITYGPARSIVKKMPQKVQKKVVEEEEEELRREEKEEVIRESEFMEEDGVDLDEEFANNISSSVPSRQRIMKPEQMDEDVPSDSDSMPSDASYYDEMPSSDSEAMDEWFALDIRAERAGDYVPLLGHKAYSLLSEERDRVLIKLNTLKNELEAINTNSKKNMKEIEDARRKIAELDGLMAQA